MPTTLTAADFLSLRMQYKAEQAENEIPAVIEHNFKDGRMVDHYFVVPGPALLADEAVQDFGGKIENILFLQQSEPGAPWQVLLHEPSMIREITFEMPEEEFRAMLAKNNLISEIDMFSDALQSMREKLVQDDREGLEEMFRLSTERRSAFDKK